MYKTPGSETEQGGSETVTEWTHCTNSSGGANPTVTGLQVVAEKAVLTKDPVRCKTGMIKGDNA